MAAKESAEMAAARKLVLEGGRSAYSAAREAGVTPQAIYLAKWYKDWKGSKNAKAN